MLGSNGLVNFSPLMRMAFLCDFASSWTPGELSSHRRNEFGGLPYSAGTSQSRNQVPVSSGKRSRDESDLDRSVQISIHGKSYSPCACCVEFLTLSSEGPLSKRRKPSLRRDASVCVLPEAVTTPFKPFKENPTGEHTWELHLPWELDEISCSPTWSQAREEFSFLREIDSADNLSKQRVHEDGHQQLSIPQSSKAAYQLKAYSVSGPVETVAGEPVKLSSNDVAAAAFPVPDSVPEFNDSVDRTSLGEVNLFPSRSEIASVTTSRSMEALVSWYDRLRELIEFKRLHGHQNVPQKSSVFPKLGAWVNKQRSHRRDLPSEKLAALEAVCFDWGRTFGEPTWRVRFAALVAYRTKYGHCKYVCDSMTS